MPLLTIKDMSELAMPSTEPGLGAYVRGCDEMTQALEKLLEGADTERKLRVRINKLIKDRKEFVEVSEQIFASVRKNGKPQQQASAIHQP